MYFDIYQLKGEIRNIKRYYSEQYRRQVFYFEIYLEEKLVYSNEIWHLETYEQLRKYALSIAQNIKNAELLRREREFALKHKYYVKVHQKAKSDVYRGVKYAIYNWSNYKPAPTVVYAELFNTSQEAIKAIPKLIYQLSRYYQEYPSHDD